MGVLSNYITERIKTLRYVSVDDDGITKRKLVLHPYDTEHIEIELAGVDLDTIKAELIDTFVLITEFIVAIDAVVDDLNNHIATPHAHPDLATHVALGLEASP